MRTKIKGLEKIFSSSARCWMRALEQQRAFSSLTAAGEVYSGRGRRHPRLLTNVMHLWPQIPRVVGRWLALNLLSRWHSFWKVPFSQTNLLLKITDIRCESWAEAQAHHQCWRIHVYTPRRGICSKGNRLCIQTNVSWKSRFSIHYKCNCVGNSLALH